MAILGISPDEMLDTQLGPNDEQRKKLNLLAATQPKQPVGIPPAAQPTPARGIPTPLGAPPNIPTQMPNVPQNPLSGITPETTLGKPPSAYERLQSLEAQGRPQLHGVKKFFDVLSQVAPLGRRIEAAIPGSPGNYDAQLGQATQAANEEMAQERTQNPPEVAAIRAQGELERQQAADAAKQQKPTPDDWHPVTGTNLEVNARSGESRPIQGMQPPAPKETPYNVNEELHKEHPDWTPEQIQEAAARPSFPRIMPVTDAKGNTLGYNYFQGTPGGKVKTTFIPAGAGGAPTAGGVIPAKPGTSLIDQGYMAQGLKEMVTNNIFPAIDQAQKAGVMGPVSGRVQNFLLKRVGDPSSPAAYLQATLDAVPMMLGRIYGYRSADYAQAYNDFLNTRMTPEALRSYLNGVMAHAGTIQSLTGPPSGTEGTTGGTVRMKAPNGQVSTVPADQVEHYKALGATVVNQ